MLKRLRLKFILINMTIVTLMLLVIFGLLYVSASRNLERESVQMMDSVANEPLQHRRPNRLPVNVRLPYFSVMLDRSGEVTEVSGDYFDLSDRDDLDTILEKALESQKETGVLKEYSLRFCVRQTPMGQRVVFADMTSERSMLQNLLKTFLLLGSAAFLAFLGISFLLAKWAVRPVERAWQQQRQFVADASHELKTPLTVIMTDAELLSARDCPEEDRQTLPGSILTMTRQMRGLVEGLLDLARLDSGSVRKDACPVSFSDSVSDAVMQFEPVFFEKGLSLLCEVEPEIAVSGSPAQLGQLISILLDNAGKYTVPGGRIVVRLCRSGRKRCILEVSDQGTPISEEDCRNIFRRFYRGDEARAMNHSYGLGLSIAQSICEEHKGKIRCESADGWNRFFAELPCRE